LENILNAMAFYALHPGWHSFDTNDRATVRAIESLRKRGFLKVISDQAIYITSGER